MNKSYLILLVWVAIGTVLRFTELGLKSPWTDEFSTMVFSLGNSFRTVPLNDAISLDVLMEPLVYKGAGMRDVIHNLLSESNHPALYFVLAHLWMKLFSLDGVNLVWVARSFPAMLGAASIPGIYALGYVAFRSRFVANLAAAIMALSPYGIFLAQEARHYTLAILFVIASLGFVVVAVGRMREGKPFSFGFSIAWMIINCLGIASHYFFVFTLVAQALVLVGFGILYDRKEVKLNDRNFWLSKFNVSNITFVLVVVAGTVTGGLVWLPVLQNSYNSELTEWIKNSDRIGVEWVTPIFQGIAAWVTMLSLLPIEVTELPIAIASGVVMLIFFIWIIPILIRGIKLVINQPNTRLVSLVFSSFVLTSIGLFFAITYLFGIDLTRGARYNFVYFPAVILLVSASLTIGIKNQPQINLNKIKKRLLTPIPFSIIHSPIAIVLLMGFLSALTVSFNLGYQKYYRPDLLVPVIQSNSADLVLIATTHKTHVQTGEMMGLGWEFKRLSSDTMTNKPLFLLAQKSSEYSNLPTKTLQNTLSKLPRPLDLWLVNFQAANQVESQNCSASSESFPLIDGYDYKLYHCR